MAKSIVSIVKGANIEEMLEELLDHLGGVKSLIRRNSTVVVKPNAGHMGPADSSVNTNPGLVAAVIKELRKARPKANRRNCSPTKRHTQARRGLTVKGVMLL